jgi:integrase
MPAIYPSRLRLSKDVKGTYRILFYIGKQRYRYAHGKAIRSEFKPNIHSEPTRLDVATELLLAFKQALDKGWRPDQDHCPATLQDLLTAYSPSPEYSEKYRRAMATTCDGFMAFLRGKRKLSFELHQLTSADIQDHLSSFNSPSSFNHERKRLSAILKPVFSAAGLPNPLTTIPKRREKATMHKPIRDVEAILEDIKQFNSNLHLCCLLTYGCLLRPHQEIRQLTWGDFSVDFTRVSLSGKRNKSGRNRVVPVPEYVLMHLRPRVHTQGGVHTTNIFSGAVAPFSGDYFKGLWTHYKAQSKLVDPNQTLYSFRHTGAIEIYKRTGNLSILQQAMGHASLAVSLGYLRNLEVPMLSVEDMPSL